MKKEKIYVIANSREALVALSLGKYNDIADSDIITCNMAYAFFRTSGKHYNVICDYDDIVRHFEFPYGIGNGYTKVEHFFSAYDSGRFRIKELFPDVNYLPFCEYFSSGVSAVLLAYYLSYKAVIKIGFTEVCFDEFIDMEKRYLKYLTC